MSTGCRPRVLVAGVGNVLRGDDGFGVALAQRILKSNSLHPDVRVVELGISGISLVQELLSGYDALIILDAVERGTEPGTLHVLEPQVLELQAMPEPHRRDFLADMHYSNPARALVLAKALNILPARVLIVGCQPEVCDDLRWSLSPAVEQAMGSAVRELEARVQAWMAS